MGATLDSLEVKISADASKAARSLTELKTALSGLNTALAPATKGLDNMVISLSKVVGMQSGLTSISKTFGSLAKSWTALNQSTNKSAAEMAGISDKARTMSQAFAKEYGIRGKESVNELTNAFHKLYSSVGDNVAMGKALHSIEILIRDLGRVKTEGLEAGNVIREMLQSTTVKLPSSVTKELGSNLINYMSKLSHVSGTEGALPSEIVKEINAALDPNRMLGGDKDYSAGFIDITGVDNEVQVLQILVDALKSAENQTISFKEAANQDQNVITDLNQKLENLAASVGTTFEGAMSSFSDAISQMVQISPALADQLMSVDNSIENISDNGNPFEGVLSSLTQLSNIKLSDSLNNITAIKDAMGKLGGENAARAAANLPGIATALKQLDGVTIPPIGEDAMNLADGLSKLGKKKIADGFTNLENIKASLMGINNLKIDPAVTQSIYQLADGLYKFGLAKMDKAVSTIPALAGSITQLVNSLSTLPAVSDNTIRLISALGNVNVNANTAANTMGGRLSRGLKLYTGNAFNARKASMSLAQAFGKMYANFFIFFRLARQFKNDIDLASDLTEVQNVVDVTFGDMADKMNEFSKAAIDSLGMSELTAKRVGSRFQAMGTAMSISDSMVKSTNDFVQTATNGYADVADSMADVSINLTRLAGDMASFYNADYADVAEDLEAVFTGLTKPLRKYGIDLTQATLKEWAMNHGMEVNMKTMSQAEKTLLRYQYVMAQSTAAHGDFQRTSTTWANSVRIATERLNQLRIVLGKIAIYTFKPLVQSFNKAMEQIIKGAEGLLNALGKIFGWQIEWNDGGILDEEADDSGELADNMGDAADNAKKFKNFLLGIDELNVLPSNDDKDKGKGSGLGNLGGLGDATGGFNIKPIEKGFDSIYDTLFKLGARINEIIKELLDSIDWDTVYSKARAFGKGLAQFVNGLLNDAETFYKIGKTLARGINAIAHIIDAYHKEFDGWQWGVDLGSLVNGFTENLDWHTIQSAAVELAHDLAQTINAAFVTIKWDKVGGTIAEGFNTAIDYFFTLGKEINFGLLGTSIATAINGFFKTFDFTQAAQTLNYWAKGLLDALIGALDRTDWKLVGRKIGEFISNIDVLEIAGKIGHALWDAVNGAISAYTGLFEGAPIATAIATALALPFTNKMYFSKYIRRPMLNWAKKIGTELTDDLSNVFSGDIFKTFGNAFKSTEIGLDSFGNLTSGGTLQGIANGFNAISASLSKTTKAIGSIAVGFSEFFVVKDAVYDIIHGTDNLALSIAELAGAVGVASVAFSALLGFPMGLIATGAAAAVGAIVGITKAMDDLRQENALAAITRDMGEAYGTLNDLAEKYKTVASNVTDGLDQLHNDYIEVEKIKNSLNEMVGGYGLVVTAINSGNQLTSGAMKELIGNIGNVKSAWEDYIQAQYNYLIQSTVNDYQFAKSQGILTEEKEKEYLDRIQELTKGREDEVKELTRLIEELEKAQGYYDAVMAQGVTGSTKEFAENQIAIATKNILDFGAATGAITDGALTDLENEINDLNNMKFDFSNIDATNYSELLTEAEGYLGQIQEKFANSSASIEQTIADRMKADPTLTREQAEKDVKMYRDALNEATKSSLDSLQLNLFDVLSLSMKDGDRQSYIVAHDMNEEFIKPLMGSITELYEQAADGEKPKLESIIFDLFKDTWSKGGFFDGGPVFKDVDANLEKYRKQLETTTSVGKDMSAELKPTEESITSIANKADVSATSLETLAGGMKETDTASSEATKSIKDFTIFTKKLDDASSKSTKGVKDLNNAFKSLAGSAGGGHGLQAMSTLNIQSGLALSSVTNVKEELEKTVNAGKGVDEVSNNFGKLGNTFTNLLSAFVPVKQGFDSFSTETQMNMQKTTTVFGESFSGIMKYGNQTISWLKGSFVPYFSGAYWNGITSSIPNAFGNAFRQAINIMMNLWKQFATWANQNMKMNVNLRGKEVTGVDVSIPQYATGGFPEDGMFMANHGEMVGQFANGKTAVANNEQIVEGIRQGVYDAVSSAMQNVVIQNNVELQGDAADFFTAMVKENNRAIMRTGASPIRT